MSENFEPNALFKPVNRTPWQDFFHHFRRNRPAVIGVIVVLLLGLIAVSASIGTTTESGQGGDSSHWQLDPNATNIRSQFVPPFSYGEVAVVTKDAQDKEVTVIEQRFYVLGTDDLGRDNLLRLWTGSTVSLLVGFVSVGISVLIGILVGGIAGFYGRGKVSLPFFLCVIGPPLALLVSTFRFMNGAELGVSIVLYGFSIVGFVAILIGAILGRGWKSLAVFGIAAALMVIFFVWPRHMEQSGHAGEALTLHRQALQGIVDVRDEYRAALAPTGDYERTKSMLEAGTPGLTSVDVERTATLAGSAQAKIAEKAALLALVRAKASLSTTLATIADAEVVIRTEESKGIQQAATEEEIRLGTIGGAKNTVTTSNGRLEALKKAVADADAALLAVNKESVVPVSKLKTTDKLQEEKAKQNQLKASHQTAEKKSIDLLLKSSTLYSFTQKLPFLILVGFFFILAFMLLSQAGQSGARRFKPLNVLFVPLITVDNFAMRSVEVLMTMPTLVLLLTIMAFYERDVWLVMFVIGILSWMGTARFVRAEILSLRERDFISAARSLGLSDTAIIVKHLVPNALSPVLVSATIGVASAIILESTLSFLGLGASPEQVTWGKMLADSRLYITHAPWLFITPGIAILIVVLAFNLLGEGLREAMNPKLRKR